MSIVAAARLTGLAWLFAVASISSALAEDLIGPETVWSPPQDAPGGYCSYSQGFGPWSECLAAQGAPVATLKVAELLQGMPHLRLGGIVTKFHELGPIDYAEIEFPSPTRSGFQVAFVNGDVSVITGATVGSFQAPQDSGTKQLLRIVPNAGPSGRFEVSGYRILPGEVQRFVLTDVLTAGCMGCEVVGISITHLDFQFGRLIGTQFIGWAPYPSPAPLGWPAQALLRGDELQLQIQLNLRGYDAGSMDGVAGSQTEAALTDFLEDNCLPRSNHLTVAAIRELSDPNAEFESVQCGFKLDQRVTNGLVEVVDGTTAFAAPSFDCTRATEADEFAICQDSELAALDVLSAENFSIALRNNSNASMRAVARTILESRHQCGSNRDCIQEVQTDAIIVWQGFGTHANQSETMETQADVLPRLESRKSLQFTDFPALAYLGDLDQITLPDFEGRDEWANNFRTRIRDGLRAGPNLSGHYSLIEIGCGTSCRFAFLGDARNGEVFSFPYGGEEQYEMELLYNLDSRLVKVTWMKDWDTCIQQDLEFDGAEFIVLGEATFPRVGFCN